MRQPATAAHLPWIRRFHPSGNRSDDWLDAWRCELASAAWLRPIADRRVRTKIMLAVLVVAFFGIFDGLYAVRSLGSVNDNVKAVHQSTREFDAIGALRTAVNAALLAADDHFLAEDAAARAQALSAFTKAETDAPRAQDVYRTNPETAEVCAVFVCFVFVLVVFCCLVFF